MTNCPVEDCNEMTEIKQAIHDGKENTKFWIRILVVVLLAVAATFIVIWADTRDLPQAKEKVASNEMAILGITKDVESNIKTIIEMKREIMEMKATQSTILNNTEYIKNILRYGNGNPDQ